MTDRRRPARTGLAGLLLAGLAAPVGGCETRCVKTALEVRPVQVSDAGAPLEISARLTRHGEPFPNARVKLSVLEVGPDDAHAGSLYHVVTDADGVATATQQGGTRTSPGYRVTGYAAYYQPLNKVDGVQYCWSQATAPITGPTP